MTFITGAFTATYGGYPLGVTEEGFEQVTTRVQEEIRCDQYRGVLDGVFQGIDMQIRMVLMEVDMPAVRRLLWPYTYVSGNAQVITSGAVGPVGSLMSSMALPLVLTPCAGTTAATKGDPKPPAVLGGPANNNDGGGVLTSITYPACVLAAEASSIRFSSSLRKYPVTLQVLPYPCPIPGAGDSAGPTCSTLMHYYAVDLVGNICPS